MFDTKECTVAVNYRLATLRSASKVVFKDESVVLKVVSATLPSELFSVTAPDPEEILEKLKSNVNLRGHNNILHPRGEF